MLDKQTVAILKEVYPDFLNRMVKVYQLVFKELGVAMRATSGYRSIEDQETLYALGRTAPGSVVTWSRPGQSLHHYWCAVDSCFVGKDPFLEKSDEKKFQHYWGTFGRFCEQMELTWGGRFNMKVDRPHAQKTYGIKLVDIQALYKKGGREAVWSAFDESRGVPRGTDWRL